MFAFQYFALFYTLLLLWFALQEGAEELSQKPQNMFIPTQQCSSTVDKALVVARKWEHIKYEL